MAMMDKGRKLILRHDGFGNDGDWDSHVVLKEFIHGCFYIEVFQIAGPEAGIRSRDEAVEECLDSGEFGSLGADIVSILLDPFAPNCETDAMGVGLLGRKTAMIRR
jgi:hypothetical protein